MDYKRAKNLIIIPVFLISFLIYLKTLCPTIYVGDNGELTSAAYTLGIAHPPGYPIWCLIGKMFTYIPIGSIAYRTNLMSAFLAGLTVCIVYLIGLKVTDQKDTNLISIIPALSGALIFAFSKTFWSQSVITEVYVLNTFFLSLTLLLLLFWAEDRKRKHLYLFSFCYGLSLTNHHTMLLFAPIFLFYIIRKERNIWKQGKTLSVMFILFLAGLSVYLYLPLRSLADPAVNWGHPQTWHDFLKHILRGQYGKVHENAFAVSLFFKQLTVYFKSLISQFTPYLTWLGLVGAWSIFKKDKDWFITTMLGFLVTGMGLLILLNAEMTAESTYMIDVFHIPSYLIMSLWISYGIGFLINFVGRLPWRKIKPVTLSLIIILPLISLKVNYFQNDRSRNSVLYDYGMNILKTLPQEAILFVRGDDSVFSMAYLKIVEKKRPDVTVYDREVNLFEDIYNFPRLSEREDNLLRLKVERELIISSSRPVYFTQQREMTDLPNYRLKREGILFKVEKKEIYDFEESDYSVLYRERALGDESIFKDYMARHLLARFYYLLGDYYYHELKDTERADINYTKASEAAGEIGAIHSDLGNSFYSQNQYKKAEEEYKKTIKYESDNAYVHYRLGDCYRMGGNKEKAADEYKLTLELEPDNHFAYHNLGVYYAEKGLFAKGIICFRKAVELEPTYINACNNLGMVYYQAGLKEKAIKEWQSVLRLDSDNQIAKRQLERLGIQIRIIETE